MRSSSLLDATQSDMGECKRYEHPLLAMLSLDNLQALLGGWLRDVEGSVPELLSLLDVAANEGAVPIVQMGSNSRYSMCDLASHLAQARSAHIAAVSCALLWHQRSK